MKDTASEKVKNEIKESINILDEQDAYPRRPRSKYAGEMMQTERLQEPILTVRRHLKGITKCFIRQYEMTRRKQKK